jgi:Domain of unknown function (DUF4350)
MPATWRSGDLTVLAIAGVATVLLTGASFLVAPPNTLPRHDGSSYAAHQDGARAAYLLLKALGYRVERSFEPVAAIRHAPERTLLVLASPLDAPSEQDVRALRTFIARGGRVLATGSASAAFLPGVPRPDSKSGEPRPGRPRRHDRALPSAITSGVGSVDMPAAAAPLPLHSPFVVVYGTDEAPAVVSARLERGEAVWWAGSTPLVNGGIGRPGHVELLVNTLGPPGERTIVWDEFYHGHTRSFWSYLSDTPFFFALLQLTGVAGLAMLSLGRRRRPIRLPAVEPRTSPLEFIDTMGGLYERARASAAAVSTVYAHVRRRLLSVLGLPPATDDERLVAVAAERLALERVELSDTLANARAAAVDPDLTARQAVPLVAALQGFAARLEGGGRGHRKR